MGGGINGGRILSEQVEIDRQIFFKTGTIPP